MIRIAKLNDVRLLREDTELWREVYGYMCACAEELRTHADEVEVEEHDFNFLVASETDAAYVQALGEPEETVDIEIRSAATRRKIRRLVYVTEVIFIDPEIGNGSPTPNQGDRT